MKERLDELLFNVSQSPSIDNGNFADALRVIINSCLQGLELERAGVWFFEKDQQAMRCYLVVDRNNHSERSESLLTAEVYPDYFNALIKGRQLCINDALNSPATREFSLKHKDDCKIESILDAPIRHTGKMIGIIHCEHAGAARIWDADEMAFVAALADFIGRAINASNMWKAQNQLVQANHKLEQQIDSQNQKLSSAQTILKNTQQQLLDSENMVTLGGLVAGITHEVNTPLGVSISGVSHLEEELKLLIEAFQSGSLNEEIFSEFIESGNEVCSLLSTNLSRAVKLIKDFKQTAVDQSSNEIVEFDLLKNVQALISSLNPEIKKAKLQIELECDDTIIMKSYPGAIAQILTNLIMNSIRHGFKAINNPKITISFSIYDNCNVLIRFIDNGCGIPQKLIDKIFEPFFTTQRENGGSGLGLSITHDLVNKKLCGNISVTSQMHSGTCFEMFVPIDVTAQ
ncbi:MAG: GAF domain-containing sensor histidine kinase [Aliiglaciecola sp.]|uniref:sensor histidine kinase n=1 Tax=Aliiglaciecola sp. TaxID=1872441 RepID=UPI003298AB3D